ncbi:MAG: hypothetical protein E7620_04280 [Ruminococcaceae bacterium]|nr:hypothetical protein [Oscillospiraceae bacterium]
MKNNSKDFKFLLVVLSFLLLLPLLVACDNGNEGGEPTASLASELDARPYLDDLPELDFGEEEVKILTWTEQAMWDWTEEPKLGEVIDTALFARQESVRDRLNVDFTVIKRDGAWAKRLEYVNNIRLSLEGGDGYDLIASHPSSAAAATVAGYFTDLNTVDYIDETKKYWPEDIWNTCQINEHLFFATGDISATAIRSISCMILNLDLYSALGFEESIYDIVERGDWTMERFKEQSLGLMAENGGYGATVGSNVEFDCLFYGAGFRYVEIDPEDQMLMLKDGPRGVNSEALGDWFVEIQQFFDRNDEAAIMPIDAAFTTGSSLWFMGYLSNVQENLLDVTFDFAIAPYPKLDSDQENYATVNGWYLTMYSVPTNAADKKLSGALMECLASEGARLVTPAVYEASFELRYLRTEKNAIMFDLLHDTLVFDVGRIFCDQLEKIGYAFRQASDGSQSWTSYRDGLYDSWDRALRGVMRSFI